MRFSFGSKAASSSLFLITGARQWRLALGSDIGINHLAAVQGKLSSPTTANFHSSSTTNLQKQNCTTMCATTAADVSVWNGKDKEAYESLSHPGYSIESDPETHTGGWLAHRAALMPTADGEGDPPVGDWIQDEIADMITKFDYASMPIGRPPKILVLYGSLRDSSFSRKLAYENARILELLGCDVRVYNPKGLPMRDPDLEDHVKVQEIRALTLWSDGHCWVSPEMHGTVTGVFKNQIDWIPLNSGSVRPTQGKTCYVSQVNGGSQSFNAVNYLRLLARWMRMPCCTNQSSVAKAWQEFDDKGRMKPSSFRDRVVDVAEEFAKFTAVMAPVSDDLTNRYSERKEKMKEGKLLTQAEKEMKKTIENSRKA
jgi:arsenic resistance protein ArsH